MNDEKTAIDRWLDAGEGSPEQAVRAAETEEW